MRQLRWILAGAVLFAISFSYRASPQDQPPQRPASATDAQKHVNAILASKSPSQAAAGYGALFKSAGADDLRRLQTNPSDSIAIQAAWELVELSIPEKPKDVVRPDRGELSRFLGFLEGRARVQAPRWWAEALLDARANRRGNVYAGGLNLMISKPKANESALPQQATFEEEGGKPVVRVGSTSVHVPADLREKLNFGGFVEGLSALITPSYCYVTAYNDVGYPYQLACIDRSSAKIRWVAKVWASWWGTATGMHHQWIEVTEQGDRIVVFGVASTGFHVEAFRIDDGVNVLRFSNSYSQW